ncbi:MAG: NTP transferase domain-containing protein [Deltaproteobacteria bacterium]|jgi:NDP-sugar pyrophosphorylase family protein|nr:NTP transferase domain-containing protein [Deltaproteobacteria bacterium]
MIANGAREFFCPDDFPGQKKVSPMFQPIEAAMILAAGFGQRLRPLTLQRPKPLLPILNRPLLFRQMETLLKLGVKRLVINAHHLSGQIAQALNDLPQSLSALNVSLSLEASILGTAGGLKKAAPLLFPEPPGLAHPPTAPKSSAFLVMNGDIFSDLDINALAIKHAQNPKAPLTLALVDRPEKATVSVDKNGQIIALRAKGPVPGEARRLCGAGIMVMERWFLDFLPEGFSDVIECLIPLLAQGQAPAGHFFDRGVWADVGTLDDYFALNRFLAQGQKLLSPGADVCGQLLGFVLAQSGAVIEPGALVEDSILLSTARVKTGARVKNAVLAGPVPENAVVSGGVVI